LENFSKFLTKSTLGYSASNVDSPSK